LIFFTHIRYANVGVIAAVGLSTMGAAWLVMGFIYECAVFIAKNAVFRAFQRWFFCDYRVRIGVFFCVFAFFEGVLRIFEPMRLFFYYYKK
jgi:hypothetical protein